MSKYHAPIYTLAAGEGLTLAYIGEAARFLSSTGASDLLIGFDGSDPEPLPVGVGITIPGGFQSVRVVNPDAAAATYQIGIAAASISDDRINGTISTVGAVPTGFTSTADKSCLAGAKTTIIAANSARKSVTISNLDGNAEILRIGGTNVAAARGVELQSGQSVTIETEAAIYAWNPGAAAQSVGIAEVIV